MQHHLKHYCDACYREVKGLGQAPNEEVGFLHVRDGKMITLHHACDTDEANLYPNDGTGTFYGIQQIGTLEELCTYWYIWDKVDGKTWTTYLLKLIYQTEKGVMVRV